MVEGEAEELRCLEFFAKELKLTVPGIDIAGPFLQPPNYLLPPNTFYIKSKRISLRVIYELGHWCLEILQRESTWSETVRLEHFGDSIDLESRIKELV